MRFVGLLAAALGLFLSAGTAEAARRNEQAPVARPAMARQAPVARLAAITPAPRGSLLYRTAHAAPSRAVRPTQSGNARQATSCGRQGQGAARCAPTRLAWQSGLMPAAGVQTSECPDGTMATLALGHANVVRCMPI